MSASSSAEVAAMSDGTPPERAVALAMSLLARVVTDATSLDDANALLRQVRDVLSPFSSAELDGVGLWYARLRFGLRQIPLFLAHRTILAGGEDWRPS